MIDFLLYVINHMLPRISFAGERLEEILLLSGRGGKNREGTRELARAEKLKQVK